VSLRDRVGRAFSAFKAASGITFATQRVWFGLSMGRTRYNYQAEVVPDTSSILMACVEWICRTFPEAPVRVCRVNADGEDEEIADHPLKLLLDTPNPYYPGEVLWSATLADRTLTGNAYWLKVRSAAARTVELYWVPSWSMEPKGNADTFITHYEYRPDTSKEPVSYRPQDVVHFRYGRFDPQNMRKAATPLRPLYRELFTDDEAANYTASMLRNVGVPPVVLSPTDPSMTPSREELEQTKQRYQEVTTGDNRGQVLVMYGPTKVDKLGYNPSEMNLGTLRSVPEERVSAVLGIPAAVVGLGSGLANTKVGATMAEMRDQAYESNIIPTQRLMSAELRSQLLPDFGNVANLKVDFDYGKVRVLQEDQDSLHARAREDLKSGGISLNEFRQMIGLQPLASADGDVFYIPTTLAPTSPDQLVPEVQPVPPALQALPPGQQEALPPGQQQDGQPAPAKMVQLRHRKMVGQPLMLTEEELAVLAIVTAGDLERARQLWQEEAPEPFAGLLDAREAT
jgi:HK97 family phage portal protein